MDSRPIPPGSVTVASMLSILTSIAVLIAGILLGLIAHAAPSGNDSDLTPETRMTLKLISYVILGIGALGSINGVGLLGLQNWARKAIVVSSGAAVVFSVYCLYISIALLGVPVASDMTPATAHRLWEVFFGLSLLVFGAGLWFVIVFTRPVTVASFLTAPAASAGATPPNPNCPLPLALLAGFYMLGCVVSVLALRVPDRTPDVVFAHALYGAPRTQYVLITSVLSLVISIGLYRVQSWSIHLAIGLELFSISNHAVNLLHPGAIPSLRSALAAMAEHGAKPPTSDPALSFHYLEGLGLGFALLLLLILLLSRFRFLQAASAPAALP
jgi:uncharacterized membrane protein (DUF2068 family)